MRDKHFWFKIASFIYTVIAFPHIYYTFSLHNKVLKDKPEFPWPSLQEMWKVLIITAAFCLGRYLFTVLFGKIIVSVVKD